MLANAEMKPNRYERWARSRALFNRIQATFAAGGIVTVATHLRVVHYEKKHSEMFKVTSNGCYVQRGKQWECIDLCSFVFSRPN